VVGWIGISVNVNKTTLCQFVTFGLWFTAVLKNQLVNGVDPMLMNEEIVVAGLPLQLPKPIVGTQLPTLAEWNQRYVTYVLNFTKGKKTAAARILGINRRTLYRRKTPKAQNDTPLVDRAVILERPLGELQVEHRVQ